MDTNVLKAMLEEGVISKEEYDKITSRISLKENNKHIYPVIPLMVEFESSLKSEYSQNTYNGYITNVRSFLQFLFNVADIKYIHKDAILPNITGKDIQLWFNKLLGEGFTPTSIRRFKYSIRKFLQYINSTYGIEIPDIDIIDIPKSGIVDIDALTDAQVRGIANHALSLRDKIMILFMYETGMRRQELLDCKKVDIDFQSCTVKIYINDKLDRVGLFSKETSKLLVQYINEWENEVALINHNRKLKGNGNIMHVSEYLFQTVKSPKMSYATIFKAIKDASLEYYLNLYAQEGYSDEEAQEVAEEMSDKVNSETLRHSRRAYLFSQGKSVEQVQAIMGDENPWVCKRYIKIAQQLYPDKI